MLRRGEIYPLKRNLGFGAAAEPTRVLVLQDDSIGGSLPTVFVVPLDEALPMYVRMPTAVPVSGPEAGTLTDQVARTALLRSIIKTRLALTPVGRATPATMATVDAALSALLGLP